MNVTCISIGDELLLGQTLDTNSHWISQQIQAIGGKVIQKLTISDSKQSIVNSLNNALSDSDIITITGGLGPTKDDITKHVLAEYFHSKLILSNEVLCDVKRFFEERNRPFNTLNTAQAMVPENCQILRNPIGTAPGMLFNYKGKLIVSLPGVPYEMRNLFLNQFLPLVKKHFGEVQISHAYFLTSGKGESEIAKTIEGYENSLPSNISLAYLPHLGSVALRLSAFGLNEKELKVFHQKEHELELLIQNILVSREPSASLNSALLQYLCKLNKTIAFAESCTGGLLSYSLTQHAGASEVFKGAIVAYSNAIKRQELGVLNSTLEKYGAVSEEVVSEMLIGLLRKMQTNYGVAVSGIAGPGGGTKEKPIGTVWIAYGKAENLKTVKMQFPGERTVVMERAKQLAFSGIIQLLKEEEINS